MQGRRACGRALLARAWHARRRRVAWPVQGSHPMNRSTVASRWNLDLIEANHQRWRNDPASVDESWRIFFEGYELGQGSDGVPRVDNDQDASRTQFAVTRL